MGTKIIGGWVNDADKKSERGGMSTLYCTLPEQYTCPLLEKGQCIHKGWNSCAYGQHRRTSTKNTKRARAYHDQLQALKETVATYPKTPKDAPKKIAYIGEYVYLPYFCMNHSDGKDKFEFLEYQGFMLTGNPFMPREKFTAQIVVDFTKFFPRAMMGGIITDFQEKSLPEFLTDLKELDPDLFAEAEAIDHTIIRYLSKTEERWWTLDNIPVGWAWTGHVFIKIGENTYNGWMTYFNHAKCWKVDVRIPISQTPLAGLVKETEIKDHVTVGPDMEFKPQTMEKHLDWVQSEAYRAKQKAAREATP